MSSFTTPELSTLELEFEADQTCLDLTQKQLADIPSSLFTLSPIESLTILILSRNSLRIVPVELYSLTALRHLDLSRNKITGLPPGISALGHLEQLNMLSNKLRISSVPLDELVGMTQLQRLDLRFNEKLEKQEASKTLRAALGLRVVLSDEDRPPAPSSDSACDRDGDSLRDQLAPWSTPQLRCRLREVFGVSTDPELTDREGVMALLLQQYELRGPREVRYAEGVPLEPDIAEALTSCLRGLSWPVTPRERPTIQADKYITLQVPNTKFTVPTGAKAKLNAAKLEKYSELWELINIAIASVDTDFAAKFTGVAITNGFRDSPHIDTENIGPFYGISFGDFQGGGQIAVESGPCEITKLNTFQRFGKVDGRYPHWVTKYSGERYSVIYYQTVGETTPMGPAVCSF